MKHAATRGFGLAWIAILLVVGPILAADVEVVSYRTVDNGDGDIFVDTLESVELYLTLRNASGTAIGEFLVDLSSDSERVRCVSAQSIPVEPMLAGETREVGPVVWSLDDSDRSVEGASADAPFAVRFELDIFSNAADLTIAPSKLDFELDLDVAGGSGGTTYFEGFESGTLSTFFVQNIDMSAGGSLASSEGYRCQYSDPDWINSNSFGAIADCYLSPTGGNGDAIFWQVDGPLNPNSTAVDGGRAYSGSHSLYFGQHLNAALGHTTPMANLEAAAMSDPVSVGWMNHCSVTTGTTCVEDADCPGGESCAVLVPRLTIKQQISLIDGRTVSVPFTESADRGVVMAQLADDLGNPVGAWQKLYPLRNEYDQTGTDNFTNCLFDPIDDGSTEDDFFDPSDPDRRLGPSSTCFPEPTFVYLGDTFEPFDSGNTGNADGPGLAGAAGVGTWVESEFDLSRFKGRRMRLRFLTSSLKAGSSTDYEQIFFFNPNPGDDGWWIDDVMISGLLSSAATASLDNQANGSLPGSEDSDGDLTQDACDNCDLAFNAFQEDLDLDAVGDRCDNCPSVRNPSQADSDSDGLGDACDVCPNGDVEDVDGDGLGCEVDNCPQAANLGQEDADGDGAGDACDLCPLDAQNDLDSDAQCGDIDNCDSKANTSQSGSVRLNASLIPAGQLESSAVNSTGQWAVYLADQEQNGRVELYSVPTQGTGPVRKLSPELQFGQSVSDFRISPDGDWVAFRSDAESPGLFNLYVSPINGITPPTQLTDLQLPGDRVREYRFAAGSTRLVFDRNTFEGTPRSVVRSVQVDGLAGQLLHPVPGLGEDYLLSGVSPDGQHVLMVGFGVGPSARDVYAVAPDSDSPTLLFAPVFSTDGVEFVDDFEQYGFTPDGQRVLIVTEGEQLVNCALDGSSQIELSDAFTGTFQGDIAGVSPQSGDWAYFTSGESLFVVPMDGTLAPRILASTLSPIDDWQSDRPQWTAAEQSLIYAVDADTSGLIELYAGSVRIPSPSRKLNSPFPASAFGVVDFAVNAAGNRVIFRADGDIASEFRLYDTLAGAPTQTPLLSGALPADSDAREFVVDEANSRIVVNADFDSPGTFALYELPLSGGVPVSIASGAPPLVGPLLNAGGLITYRASNANELFATLSDDDPDGDGVLSFCDTCAASSDVGQLDSDGDGAGAACDCDDGNPLRSPLNAEVCDGYDSDCEGGLLVGEVDADGDDYLVCGNFVGSLFSGGGDCDDTNPTIYPGAPELNDGLDNQCSGDANSGIVDELSELIVFGDALTLAWDPQVGAAGYQAARSSNVDFSGTCTLVPVTGTSATDPTIPSADTPFFYLVRSTTPNLGSWGAGSDGSERVFSCP